MQLVCSPPTFGGLLRVKALLNTDYISILSLYIFIFTFIVATAIFVVIVIFDFTRNGV